MNALNPKCREGRIRAIIYQCATARRPLCSETRVSVRLTRVSLTLFEHMQAVRGDEQLQFRDKAYLRDIQCRQNPPIILYNDSFSRG